MARLSISYPKQNSGFTLVELILVIVLLGIVGVTITTLYSKTIQGYLEGEARITMSATARQSLDRVGREVREAMPASVRVNATQDCVEFVPIVGATRYINLPTTQPQNTLTFVEPDASTEISGLNTTNLYVMVIPLNQNEVYNTSGHFGQIASFTKLGGNETQANLTANTRFNRKSPQQRLFFVRQPVSICVTGGNLNRYTNYGFNIAQPAIGAMGAATLLLNRLLLNNNGTPINPFSYSPGTLSRSGLLLINFVVEGRNESINLEHEVHVRNIP